MKIKNGKLITEFPIDINKYCLQHNEKTDEWSLNYHIDMSYKGKEPQLGCPILFIDDEKIIKKLQETLITYVYNN
jgi:hypothetical protein